MGRMPRREERETSQRTSAEFREQLAANALLQVRVDELEKEVREQKDRRNSAENTCKALTEDLKYWMPLDGRETAVAKMSVLGHVRGSQCPLK